MQADLVTITAYRRKQTPALPPATYSNDGHHCNPLRNAPVQVRRSRCAGRLVLRAPGAVAVDVRHHGWRPRGGIHVAKVGPVSDLCQIEPVEIVVRIGNRDASQQM